MTICIDSYAAQKERKISLFLNIKFRVRTHWFAKGCTLNNLLINFFVALCLHV